MFLPCCFKSFCHCVEMYHLHSAFQCTYSTTSGCKCLESYDEFLVIFSTSGSFCLEFVQTVTSETLLKKKPTVQFSQI